MVLKDLGRGGYDGNKRKKLIKKKENGRKMERAICMGQIICP